MSSKLDARATHVYTGVSRLRAGTMVIGDVLVVTSVLRFVFWAPYYPVLGLGIVATALLLVAAALMWIFPVAREVLSDRTRFAMRLGVCAIILGLDLAASWDPGSTIVLPCTCIGVGGLLAASVVGMVGAGGIGVVLYEVIRSFQYAQTCAVMLIMIVVVTCIDVFSARVRKMVI